MKLEKQHIKFRIKTHCFVLLLLSTFIANAQLKTYVDSTSIKIGEELFYSIEAEIDSTTLVLFPEGQTFQPMEMIESYPIDSVSSTIRLKLIKKYGLTQFDSGTYTIPRQKILIGEKTLFSDSIKINVNPVAVDTTKQKMYAIKPIINVQKQSSFWGKFWWFIIVLILIISGLIYWFVLRKKPLTEEEKIAALPPYKQAKLALKKLDEQTYFEHQKVKEFYSELTFILRKYLNEKVYDQALESTTEELIVRLNILKDAKEILINKETIENIQGTLQRADLVKFAKSKPDFEIARMDKHVIEKEIDHVKAALPEPNEEELLNDLAYQKELEQKRKRKKITTAGLSIAGVLIILFSGLSLHYGFRDVKDTLLRHPSKLLLETSEWVTSEYGAPGIIVETPEVLERQDEVQSNTNNKGFDTKIFSYKTKNIPLEIVVKSSKTSTDNESDTTESEPLDLLEIADQELDLLEKKGAVNIIPRSEQFITPNGQEGIKTYGTTSLKFQTNKFVDTNFIILGFSTSKVVQQLIMIWETDDVYANEIATRILNSVELIKLKDD